MVSDFPSAINAELTVLAETPAKSQVSILSWEQALLTVSGAKSLACGSSVKVAQADRLWLGEVIDLRADGTAVIQVVHSLKNLQELSRLADQFLGRHSESVRVASSTLS